MDAQIRENVWHLFGVDYMSNELIRNYFHINPHFRIEWINDSSCNLVFNSKVEADEAVLPLVKGDGMKDEGDSRYDFTQFGMSFRITKCRVLSVSFIADWRLLRMPRSRRCMAITVNTTDG